jgi:hypothetical protein
VALRDHWAPGAARLSTDGARVVGQWRGGAAAWSGSLEGAAARPDGAWSLRVGERALAPGERWVARRWLTVGGPALGALLASGVSEVFVPKGFLSIEIVDEGGERVAGRVVLEGPGGRSSVVLGEGRWGRALEAGRWRVIGVRGPRRGWDAREVEVKEGEEASVRLSPGLAWEAPGWWSADLNQRWPLEGGWGAWLSENLAAEVDLAGLSEVGVWLDPGPEIEARGLVGALVGVPGLAVVSGEGVRIGLHPWSAGEGPGGAPLVGSRRGLGSLLGSLRGQGGAGVLLQRLGDEGASGGVEEGFHAVEVCGGLAPGASVEGWFAALGEGRVVAPLGGSGGAGAGAARVWIWGAVAAGGERVVGGAAGWARGGEHGANGAAGGGGGAARGGGGGRGGEARGGAGVGVGGAVGGGVAGGAAAGRGGVRGAGGGGCGG